MIKKLAFLGVFSSALLVSVPASATPQTNSPFPEGESLDYSVNIAMGEAESPFPQGESLDHSVNVVMAEAGSAFPQGDDKDRPTGLAA